MIKLNKQQKSLYAEKLIDLANIAVGGLVFGQSIFSQQFSLKYAIVGLLILMILYLVSFWLTKRREYYDWT